MTRAIENEQRLSKLENDVKKLFEILEEALRLGAKDAKQKSKAKKTRKTGKK
jgi:ElaB/YqjD/DUF883 family membrane-anchored ribosome-binding protein|tara:strand:- start:696 stop:851 length:156 start_codon:yes stop_codon:yes gene_type:complete